MLLFVLQSHIVLTIFACTPQKKWHDLITTLSSTSPVIRERSIHPNMGGYGEKLKWWNKKERDVVYLSELGNMKSVDFTRLFYFYQTCSSDILQAIPSTPVFPISTHILKAISLNIFIIWFSFTNPQEGFQFPLESSFLVIHNENALLPPKLFWFPAKDWFIPTGKVFHVHCISFHSTLATSMLLSLPEMIIPILYHLNFAQDLLSPDESL